MFLCVSKLKLQALLQLYFNSFIYFFELEQRGMYDIEKRKLMMSVSFFSSTKTANVCPSFHPYCMTD